MTGPAAVVATAPVRVADVGGWTDTWFGSPGQVCHLAVGPGVEVEARRSAEPGVRLHAPAVEADAYEVRPSPSGGWAVPLPGRHPLLEHAIGAIVEGVGPLEDGSSMPGVELAVRSEVPPGASLGTSASVVVALLGALDALLAGGHRSAAELAVLAHQVETERAGRQSGVQDQWAAAMGGAALLAVGPYPDVRRRELDVPATALAELGDRLATVVFGPHDSSTVHTQVIDALVTCGGVEHHHAREALRLLSTLAGEAAAALEAGDVDGWAQVLARSVDAQGALHPSLVGPRHRAAIEVARALGCTGWKVNGAGGDGGSLTVVLPPAGSERDPFARLATALAEVDPTWTVLHLRPSPGLQVTPP